MAAVSRPVQRKTIRHPAITAPCFLIPTAMPYATKPPISCAQPLKLNQMPVRKPCSEVVYHCDVSNAKPDRSYQFATQRK